MDYENAMRKLKTLRDPDAVEGMARYGINPKNNYGISMPKLRSMAKEIGRDHALAQQLWSSGIHDARILASLVDIPEVVTIKQMDNWVKDFDSWDVCDQVCNNLFSATRFTKQKALEWSRESREFTKRAGFTLMAQLAVHDKTRVNAVFAEFLEIIKNEANDPRNYVRKAVNWALRQIGKRNIELNKAAIQTAKMISEKGSKNAKWIASDAIRELTSDKIIEKLNRKEKHAH
jgi:3-methyladenine DNA glycosylase AlkD